MIGHDMTKNENSFSSHDKIRYILYTLQTWTSRSITDGASALVSFILAIHEAITEKLTTQTPTALHLILSTRVL